MNTKGLKPPSIKPYAGEFLEYGENKDDYWIRDKFMSQMESSVTIAEIKYPKSEGWRHAWGFDRSSYHAAMADDALDVPKKNVNPRSKHLMHDIVWNGNYQSMNFTKNGQKFSKGMEIVLQE